MTDIDSSPEKIYTGFLRIGLILGIFTSLIISLAIVYVMRSTGVEISWTFVIILPIFLALGEYVRYLINTRVSGFPGKTINSKNQRHIKQVVFVIFPIALSYILIMSAKLIQKYTLPGYIILLVLLIISELLFFSRLKNLERTEGKDNSPVLTTGEAFIVAILVIFLFVLVYFAYLP